jgi:hypothetical protein
MHRLFIGGLVLLTVSANLSAAEPTTTIADFENGRPSKWTVNFGGWEAENGYLVARQLEKDNHAAAARWQIPLADGTVALKLKFEGATGFHIGFDPASGTLDKKGHLYSLIITPSTAQLRKHRDKAKDDSKDVVLATAGFPKTTGQWINVELTTVGDKVTATIDNGSGATARLEATDPTFHVAKPAIVFRTIGDHVLIDDVKVTVAKPR